MNQIPAQQTLTAAGDGFRRAVAASLFRLYPHIPDRFIIGASRALLGQCRFPMGQEFLEKALMSLKTILRNANPTSRDRIIEALLVNECIRGTAERDRYAAKHGYTLPTLLVISPTMRCPLRCYGCYAAQYPRSEDLDYAVFDRLLTEAKSLGIYFFVVSGGEPFTYPGILDLFAKHNDAWFQVYTSGITLDRSGADSLRRLGNVIPCISVEGFEKETDTRRGKGHFSRVLGAFANLRERGVPFGFSATATRANSELIVSDEFVEFYQAQGASLGWYFQYMPIGREPNFDLVPTAEQRNARFLRLLDLRHKYDLLLIDFWNDGPLTGGCIAGGRGYLHVNNAGDVEPCVFCQMSTDSVYQKGLAEILHTSRLFRAIRKRQPYSENLLRPCMIIDNPHILKEITEEASPRETCGGGARQLATEFYPKLERLAEEYRPYADKSWTEVYGESYRACHEHECKLGEYFQGQPTAPPQATADKAAARSPVKIVNGRLAKLNWLLRGRHADHAAGRGPRMRKRKPQPREAAAASQAVKTP